MRSISFLGLAGLLLSQASVGSAGIMIPRQAATTIARMAGSWEGLGVRANGKLVVSRMDSGDLYEVDPSAKTISKLVSLPGVTGAAAMTEIAPDVFAVVGGKSVYRVDLSASPPAVAMINKAAVSDSKMFNGLTMVNNNTLIVGDLTGGALFRIIISTGAADKVFTDATLGGGVGVDGVRYHDGYIYFTNIGKSLFCKVAVDKDTGKPSGTVTTILSGTPGDDFTFGPDGSAYIATNMRNSVIKVTPEGKMSTVGTVSGSTMCAFGRTDKDKNVLYVTGSGAVSALTVA